MNAKFYDYGLWHDNKKGIPENNLEKNQEK